MKVLVIAPHPDDEVLGCGGTIKKHINKFIDIGVDQINLSELAITRHNRRYFKNESCYYIQTFSFEQRTDPGYESCEQGPRV